MKKRTTKDLFMASSVLLLTLGCGSSSGLTKTAGPEGPGARFVNPSQGEDGGVDNNTGGSGSGGNDSGSGGNDSGSGDPGLNGDPNGTPGLTLRPGAATMIYGATVTFLCTVDGYADTSCTFTADGGKGKTTGVGKWAYTAPSTTGTYHVTATANANKDFTQTATLRVVAPGAPGEWIDVTPEAMRDKFDDGSPDGIGFGVQDVLVDPVRPSDLYAFVCRQGVWRSQDYGQTWTKVSQSTELETGRPWGAGVQSDLNRNKDTSPALYTFNGYGGPQGIFKSTDFGVHWTKYSLPTATGQDAYSVDVDPYDGGHLLVGFHEAPGLIESTNGGKDWRVVPLPDNSGVSIYAYFVDTGSPSTTATTWLIIPQADSGQGTWRTTSSGGSWSKVENFTHSHGSSQVFQQGDGAIYVGGVGGTSGNGIYRSTNFGETWSSVFGSVITTVVGTPNYLYANNAQGWGPGSSGMVRATRSSGTDWQSMDTPGMIDGSKRMVVTYDGTHQVIVAGNWKAGIWRYVEP